MQGVAAHPPDEVGVEHVDRGVARPVDESSGFVAQAALGLLQLGVFDDSGPAVDAGDDPHLLVGIGLADHLARHLGALEVVQAEEFGVGDAHQRVVDLVVEDPVDPAPGHVVERPRVGEREQGASVAVRALDDALGRFEDQAALEVAGRHDVLAEDHDIGRGEAEAAGLVEEGAGRGVGRRARHDVPGHGTPETPGEAADLLGLEREEAARSHRAHREGPLRLGEAQPCALPPSHDEDADAPRSQHLVAPGGAPLAQRAVATVLGQRDRRSRGEGPRGGGRGERLDGTAAAELPLGEVRRDASRLREQRLAAAGIDLVPEGEDVVLAVSAEAPAQ